MAPRRGIKQLPAGGDHGGRRQCYAAPQYSSPKLKFLGFVVTSGPPSPAAAAAAYCCSDDHRPFQVGHRAAAPTAICTTGGHQLAGASCNDDVAAGSANTVMPSSSADGDQHDDCSLSLSLALDTGCLRGGGGGSTTSSSGSRISLDLSLSTLDS
uniref:Uncharacterized protein n=2 Tax=Oryza brachyantha TaxID=4533 RepID=J3LJK5_ORYBR